MNDYEMMYILRPSLTEEQIEQEIGRYQDLLGEYSVKNLQIQNLGRRRLAYEIQKYQEGIYVQMNYSGDGKQVAPLERAMRLSDEVLRYLTIKLQETAATQLEADPSNEPVQEQSPPQPEPVSTEA